MPTTDPIADMLTRIRNGLKASQDQVDIPASSVKEQIARVLKREGYIKDFQVIETGAQGVIRVLLKYTPTRQRVIVGLKRVSRPGLRQYSGRDDLPVLYGGLGTVIVSTSKGIMTAKQARKKGVGGEVLAYVW